MKILHLLYSQQVSGAEKNLLDLLPGLSASGVECHLVVVTRPEDEHKFVSYVEEINSKNIKATLMTCKSRYILTAKEINNYVNKHDINYIHSHLFRSDLLAVMIKKLFNKKIYLISTRHGYQEKFFKKFHLLNRKNEHTFYHFLSRFLLKNINKHMAVSKAIADLYLDLHLIKKPITIIHHGVNQSLFTDHDPSECKKIANQIIIVGRLEAIKGHQFFFKALPTVLERFPDAQLIIMGDGTEKNNLKRLAKTLGIEKSINFLGFQPKPFLFIAQSEIMLQTSLYESFGLVFIEAFALKTPVIAFDVPAGNEIIINNETGILVPLFDIKVLSEKIIYLLENPSERKRISDNAYKKFEEYYNAQRMVDETVAWYKTFVTD